MILPSGSVPLLVILLNCIVIVYLSFSFADFPSNFIFYFKFFFRGQISSSNTLEHSVLVELINDGLKYKVSVTKSGANSYFLVMNGSFKEIEVHRLSDGGKLFLSYSFRIVRTF